MYIDKPGRVMQSFLQTPEQLSQFQSFCDTNGLDCKQLLDSKTPITTSIAILLGKYFNVSYHFWIIREEQYRTAKYMRNQLLSIIDRYAASPQTDGKTTQILTKIKTELKADD